MAYSDKVIDHYENPRNVGSFDKNDPTVGTGMVGAPACFAGSTIVSVPSRTGTATLKELYDQNKPIFVWSYNRASQEFEIKKAICVKTGHKQTIKLTFDDGGEVFATPDHLFLDIHSQYTKCELLLNSSLKSFNKIIDNTGYWQINRKQREHVALVKAAQQINETLMWKYNIDHVDGIKTNNDIENLKLLTISAHNYKSKNTRQSRTIAEQVEELALSFSYEDLHRMTTIEELPRWQIGNNLGLSVEWVKELQRYFGLTPMPKRLSTEETRVAARVRKLRDGNPNFSGISDAQMIQFGNELFTKYGKLTAELWRTNAPSQGFPSKVEHRFGKFSIFAEQAINYNHKIVKVEPGTIEDVYCLQVEENNNFVVLTSLSLNRQSGIVVKNCGDVMKLQIKVSADGIIEDAKFKTYGCGSAIASSSLVTEWVKGMHIDEAQQLKNSQIADELALPPVKIHCSILAEDAIKAAVADYKTRHAAEAA